MKKGLMLSALGLMLLGISQDNTQYKQEASRAEPPALIKSYQGF